VLLVAVVAIIAVLWLTVFGPSGASTGDTAPVNLSTPVDTAAGLAHRSAIVHLGAVRIEVLTPTLLRLEYSPSEHFEDGPTVNAVDRRMPVPSYSHGVSDGWLTVRTSEVTLRYKVGSGPFTAADTSLRFDDGEVPTTVQPTWEWECPYDQTCQAGAAVLGGGASLGWSQSGYLSSAGYVSGLVRRGARATWDVLGAPGGRAALSVRYSSVSGGRSTARPHTIELIVNGHLHATLSAPPTSSSDPWSTVGTTASLQAGRNTVEVLCGPGDSCNMNVDSLTVGPAGAAVPTQATDPLGGWIRGFDTFTYSLVPTCAPGTAGATCDNTIEPLHSDGLLDRAGWRLLDDTQSPVWTSGGWVASRPPGGDLEDGYLFAYGQGYTGALRTFARLTGPAPLLPRDVFGVWYSDYTPYSSADIEDSVYSAFERADVPLDTLSLDTDWKSPNDWDGWEWNSALFPHPSAFLRWARSHGIDVTLNVHSSISIEDPQLSKALGTAPLAKSACMVGICYIWDWSSPAQAESNFALQQSFEQQGVAFWWLDWCCDESVASMPGLTPDAWIGHLYAQEMVDKGERGFVLARIGSSNADTEEVYPAGPWSDHTSAVAFTGDAWGTWDTLAQEVALTPDEATIGEPYVSDDIGSYLGPPPQEPRDPPDLYDRWVQFGTFQPILRLHSDNEDRLPWQYPQPVQGITEDFLRLREALVPYTYTLAARAHQDGLPMTQPLYLEYPGQSAAYAHPEEYLYGSDMVVAPVTSPGDDADTTVWIPPGRWIDYFTGATFDGPSTVTMSVPLNRMPVLVRAGGIVPEDAPSAPGRRGAVGTMDLDVYSGSSGSFRLYDDSGTGLGYTKGQDSETQITDSLGSPGAVGAPAPSRVTVGPAVGNYPGRPTAMRYRIDMVDLTRPSQVTLDGKLVTPTAPGSSTSGWYYQSTSATVVVNTPPHPTDRSLTVVATGAAPVNQTEPSAGSG
jgi:hypothetical protein